MASKQDDQQLEAIGEIAIGIIKHWYISLPVAAIGYMVFLHYFIPEKYNKIMNVVIPFLKTGATFIAAAITLGTIFFIIRFIILRAVERKKYTYYRLVPHVDQSNSIRTIEDFIQQMSGNGRTKRERSVKGREWFQWIIYKNSENEIEFYAGVPGDRKNSVFRSLENMYPEAEFLQVDEVKFPDRTAKGGNMVMKYNGLDSGLPLKTYSGKSSVGDLLAYLEPGTWLDFTFSPDSNRKLRKKLIKSEKKMREFHDKLSDMDSYQKERFNAIKSRVTGQDRIFKVSISIAASNRYNTAVRDAATKLTNMVTEDNGIEFRRGLHQIKRCPYPTRQVISMTGRELANLVHLPDTNHEVMEHVPHLERGERNLADDEFNEGITVGFMKHPVIKNRPVKIHPETYREHSSTTGQTGSGKSSQVVLEIQAMLDEWLKDPKKAPGFTFFDPAKESADTILNRMLLAESKGVEIPWEKVHYISFYNTKYPAAMNLFHKPEGEDTTRTVENIMGLFKTAFPGDAIQVNKYLENTVKALVDDTQDHTVLGVTKMFTDEDFRQDVIDRMKDPILKQFWQQQDERKLEQNEPPIWNRINPFQSSDFMRRMFGQSNWSFPLKQWMDEGHVVLVDMSGISSLNITYTVGHLINQFHIECAKRKRKRRLHMLYVDEAHLAQVPIIPTIIAFDRKNGLGLNLISQSLHQYNQDILNAIEDVLTTIKTGKVGDKTAKIIETLSDNAFTASYLKNLPQNTMAVLTKTKINGRKVVRSCTVSTTPPFIYLPTGKAANYDSEKEMEDAWAWTQEKANELMERDGLDAAAIDLEINKYMGFHADQSETDWNVEDIKRGDAIEEQHEEISEKPVNSKVDLTKGEPLENEELVIMDEVAAAEDKADDKLEDETVSETATTEKPKSQEDEDDTWAF